MRLNHHGNFEVQRFQLFEQIIKDDSAPRPTVPYLPLYRFQQIFACPSTKRFVKALRIGFTVLTLSTLQTGIRLAIVVA